MEDFKTIENLYYRYNEQKKLGDNYILLFVYNSEKTIRDQIHLSECVLKNERSMIVSSFRKVFKYVYAIDGEQSFIDRINKFKNKFNYIYVYSMAQNIDGVGRRCLIPLLCEFHGLINIGSNFESSYLSDNKTMMYKLIKESLGEYIPKSYYIKTANEIIKIAPKLKKGKWVIKPNDESASIGVYVLDFNDYTIVQIVDYLNNYKQRYPVFFIQEYIDGQEVAVPLLYHQGEYYCPGISEVEFLDEKNYLDYNTVQLTNYSFKEYNGILKEKLISVSIEVAEALGFDAISRIDFRIKDHKIFIEDIGSNPTISDENGVNILFRDKLKAPSSCVYELLVYSALSKNHLFIPSFNNSK